MADLLSEEQDKFLKEASASVKKNAYFMRKAMDEDNLREALRYSAAMLGELRTSYLQPQRYYELYMQVFDELSNLEVRCCCCGGGGVLASVISEVVAGLGWCEVGKVQGQMGRQGGWGLGWGRSGARSNRAEAAVPARQLAASAHLRDSRRSFLSSWCCPGRLPAASGPPASRRQGRSLAPSCRCRAGGRGRGRDRALGWPAVPLCDAHSVN